MNSEHVKNKNNLYIVISIWQNHEKNVKLPGTFKIKICNDFTRAKVEEVIKQRPINIHHREQEQIIKSKCICQRMRIDLTKKTMMRELMKIHENRKNTFG